MQCTESRQRQGVRPARGSGHCAEGRGISGPPTVPNTAQSPAHRALLCLLAPPRGEESSKASWAGWLVGIGRVTGSRW